MDAVVILPVDTSATGPVSQAGKRLVYVNRKPTNLPKGVVYCGSKSIEAGIMNMEELGKCMGGKGNQASGQGEVARHQDRSRTGSQLEACRGQDGHGKLAAFRPGDRRRRLR